MSMYRRMLRAKIHRATVTHANRDYEGSLTLPPFLLSAADMREYEAVHVWNVTRGTRFETYAIAGEPDSNAICVNGAAAHLAGPGDVIIIACFVDVPETELHGFYPKLVFVDKNNGFLQVRQENPGPHTPESDMC